MLSTRYFKISILLMSSLVFSEILLANEVKEKCGDHIFKVKIFNGTDFFERKFELSYRQKGKKYKVFYTTEPGMGLDAACIQNIKSQYLMLFQVFCGGNACPEDIYGIFNPATKKMLIKPNDWTRGNSKQVKDLIGYAPPFYDEESKTFFCCDYRQLKDISPKKIS